MSRSFTIIGAAGLLALVVVGAACSGATRESEATQPERSPSTDREAALANLEKRQSAACEGVGKTLFACAVEEARATMSPEEFAKLEPEQLEPEYMSRFLDECLEKDMSARQVSVYEECLGDTRCEVFVPCLDRARPQQPAVPGPGDDAR
jgi:hypothetical protein